MTIMWKHALKFKKIKAIIIKGLCIEATHGAVLLLTTWGQTDLRW